MACSHLRSLYRTKTLRVTLLATTVTYCATFLIALPIYCHKQCYSSPVYSPSRTDANTIEHLEAVNKERLQVAVTELDALKQKQPGTTSVVHEPFNKDIVVMIVTMKRKSESKEDLGYLTQVVWAWYKAINHHLKRPSIGIAVCNVHPEYSIHSESVRLSTIVHTVHKYKNVSAVNRLYSSKFLKEKDDYVHCLREAKLMGPKYVLLAEDDALPREDIFEVMQHVLDVNMYNMRTRTDGDIGNQARLGFLKMYFPEKWRGYSWEAGVAERLGCAVLVGSLFAILSLSFDRRQGGQRLAAGIHILVFTLGAAYTTLLLTAIGRQDVMELRRASKYLYRVRGSPDCCTQAVLYPAEVIEGLVAYMQKFNCSKDDPVDLRLAKYFRTTDLQTYYVEPNLVKHIGMVSSLKGQRKNALLDFLIG